MQCPHLEELNDAVTSATEGCAECLESGSSWVQLRMCTSCGHVGCCDSSRNRHATRHFQETGHPIIRAYDRAEGWLWCYVDRMMVERETSSR